VRIVVATDRSKTAERAVAWAGELAARYAAELIVLQVVPANGGVHADPPQAIVTPPPRRRPTFSWWGTPA